MRLLLEVGLLPDLEPVEPHPSEIVAYDPQQGVFCRHQGPGQIPFNEEALAAARALLHPSQAVRPPLEGEALMQVGRLFAVTLRRTVGRRLKSVDFLRNLKATGGT
jgi:hypothetical protein